MPLTTMESDSHWLVIPVLIGQEPKSKGIPFRTIIKRKIRTCLDHSVVQSIIACPTYGPVDKSTSISATGSDETCFPGGRSGFLPFGFLLGSCTSYMNMLQDG